MGSIIGGVIEEFDLHKGLQVENKRAGFDGRPSSSGGALQSGEKTVDRERERKIGTIGGKPEGMEEATVGGLGFRIVCDVAVLSMAMVMTRLIR
ncbi:hypothetical protein F0562_036223 [Nyssa sinensis]|uniref:Uncharacterized protein n=1 Tax=Nyssa sinensis TaxID=561372 RepID=A0A5J5AFB0_9ASTE|nr:hypothetical protein F0562_036223 [Nyssa sinensis]